MIKPFASDSVFVPNTAKKCLLLVILLLMPAMTFAQASNSNEDPEPVFVPPEIGLPSERLGAGTRDITENLDGPIFLLAPPGGGYTSLAKPPLIWRLTAGFRGTIQAQIEPIVGTGVSLERNGAFPPGYYAIDLARSDFDLEVGKVYRFTVRLVSPNETIARVDTVIERVQAPKVNPGQAGIWFDVLAPLVSIDLSGRVRVADPEKLSQLLEAGGVEQ